MNTPEKQIIRLTLLARLELLPGIINMVRETAGKLGLDDRDAYRLELVVEEACVNVIEHAFEDESGNFDITLLRRPGQIVVAVEDRGLPFNYKNLEAGHLSGLGTILMKAFADEVHFLNLGRNGKRVELVKNLPDKKADDLIREAQSQPVMLVKPVPIAEKDITIRLMRPEESFNLARCVYRCYGYTYFTDQIYFPEKVREMIESGLMVSVVALNPADEIIGHVSVIKETPYSPVGEAGQAIVDPRFRGGGIFRKMEAYLRNYCKSTGMLGQFAEAVTEHTYSQLVGISGDAFETGILLGDVPATMYFKNIQKAEVPKRRPDVFFYARLNEGPLRDVYLPPHHTGILRRIYEHGRLKRNFLTAGEMPELPERSQVDVTVLADASQAILMVKEYGQDLEDLVKFRLRELCVRRIESIYIDMPLSHPAVQRYCASIEMLGFFFGGILPEMEEGDILILQYYNNVELELENVQLAFDFSKELFQYVLKAGGLR
ncbi:MAG: ATP-binding protein [Dehalococcoidales bacterium]|nr:ATP-binding protein [Dehalococcoidales bacterium]